MMIVQLFGFMFSVKSPTILLLLNPLDVWGDNQVRFFSLVSPTTDQKLILVQINWEVFEKRKTGHSVIYFMELKFTSQVAKDIEKGVYSFIYLFSPSLKEILRDE